MNWAVAFSKFCSGRKEVAPSVCCRAELTGGGLDATGRWEISSGNASGGRLLSINCASASRVEAS